MRDQKEDRTRRRFFQILQQGIGGIGVHVVSGIDDHHTVAAVMRCHRQEAVDAPDLIDRQQRREFLSLVIEWPGQVQDRRMRAHGDLSEQGRSRIGDGKRIGRALGYRMRKQVMRNMVCQRRLADAARPGQQHRMRQLAGAICAGEQ